MDINYELFKMFDKVVKTGSFTKASEEMFVSQSAVTQAIKRLEDQLDGTLFVRSKTGVTLTEAGKELYDFVKQSVETLDNAGRIFIEHKNLERGAVRIACGSTLAKLILDDAIIKFAKDYPNVEISIKNDVTSQSIERVANGKVDMAIITLPCKIEFDNIKITNIKEVEYCFFTNRDFYEETINKEIVLNDIEKFDLALPAKETNSRIWLDSKMLENNIVLKSKYEFSSANILSKFVEKMNVIGYINKEFIKEKLECGEFVELIKNFEADKKNIAVATLDKKIASPATLKLIEYLK